MHLTYQPILSNKNITYIYENSEFGAYETIHIKYILKSIDVHVLFIILGTKKRLIQLCHNQKTSILQQLNILDPHSLWIIR